MKRPIGRYAALFGWVLAVAAIVCRARPAFAESHRVAAVDPDEQLAHALDVALSPWGTIVTTVAVGAPGTSLMLSPQRAREIAEETKADVVVWVAGNGGRYAVWIYDVASDWSSLRELSSSPPFNATTSAAVALSVKALLRFTIVAPPLERYGATAPEATWDFGLTASAAVHFGAASPAAEARGGFYVGYWPEFLAHRWGVIAGVSPSTGLRVDDPGVLSGQLFDVALRGALAYRLPLAGTVAFEPSLGASAHILTFSFNILEKTESSNPSQTHFAGRFDGQVAVNFAMLGGLVHVAPWVGGSVTMFNRHAFQFNGITEIEDQPFVFESGLRAEFSVP